jgi:hypothetical protein
MKRVIFSVLFILAGIYVSAQNEMVNSAVNLSIAAQANNSLDKGHYIEGSPYLITDTLEGSFYQKNKPVILAKTRLNYFQSTFEYSFDKKTYLVDANSTDSVVVNGKTYVYRKIEVNSRMLPRIVEVVERGKKGSIYKFTQVDLKSEVKASGYVEPKPASYSWNEPVYLIEMGNQLITLTNFKKLTGVFPEKETVIKEFIKKNKIKKDNPSDLKKLLDFLDQQI